MLLSLFPFVDLQADKTSITTSQAAGTECLIININANLMDRSCQ